MLRVPIGTTRSSIQCLLKATKWKKYEPQSISNANEVMSKMNTSIKICLTLVAHLRIRTSVCPKGKSSVECYKIHYLLSMVHGRRESVIFIQQESS